MGRNPVLCLNPQAWNQENSEKQLHDPRSGQILKVTWQINRWLWGSGLSPSFLGILSFCPWLRCRLLSTSGWFHTRAEAASRCFNDKESAGLPFTSHLNQLILIGTRNIQFGTQKSNDNPPRGVMCLSKLFGLPNLMELFTEPMLDFCKAISRKNLSPSLEFWGHVSSPCPIPVVSRLPEPSQDHLSAGLPWVPCWDIPNLMCYTQLDQLSPKITSHMGAVNQNQMVGLLGFPHWSRWCPPTTSWGCSWSY